MIAQRALRVNRLKPVHASPAVSTHVPLRLLKSCTTSRTQHVALLCQSQSHTPAQTETAEVLGSIQHEQDTEQAAEAYAISMSLAFHSNDINVLPYNRPPKNATSDEINKEILGISIPVLATLAADPIAGLVGTAIVGRLGSVELAACGVALSIFNTATKLFNVPLLSVTTSAVAAATGRQGAQSEISSAASSSIVLALVAGLLQAALLGGLGAAAVSLWGAPAGGVMFSEALAFLQVRAFGAPVTILMLVLQGIFRGMQDTRTPLYATVLANVFNVVMAPLLVFNMQMGAQGAAWATVLGEFLPCVWLLQKLSTRTKLRMADLSTLRDVMALFVPTGFLMLRTVAIAGTFALATSMAARAGPTAAATHQICSQVWLASSLLADSLAVAAQTLLARSIAASDLPYGREVVGRSVGMAAVLGLTLCGGLAIGHNFVPQLFTRDPILLSSISSIMPFVILTQPLNALAFVADGVLFGAGGFQYASVAMSIAAIPPIGVMVASTWGWLPGVTVLQGVWVGLTMLIAMRGLSIYVPYALRVGPFAKMFAEGGEAQAAHEHGE